MYPRPERTLGAKIAIKKIDKMLCHALDVIICERDILALEHVQDLDDQGQFFGVNGPGQARLILLLYHIGAIDCKLPDHIHAGIAQFIEPTDAAGLISIVEFHSREKTTSQEVLALLPKIFQ